MFLAEGAAGNGNFNGENARGSDQSGHGGEACQETAHDFPPADLLLSFLKPHLRFSSFETWSGAGPAPSPNCQIEGLP
jgi:hypothetical protein